MSKTPTLFHCHRSRCRYHDRRYVPVAQPAFLLSSHRVLGILILRTNALYPGRFLLTSLIALALVSAFEMFNPSHTIRHIMEEKTNLRTCRQLGSYLRSSKAKHSGDTHGLRRTLHILYQHRYLRGRWPSLLRSEPRNVVVSAGAETGINMSLPSNSLRL